MKSVLSRPPRSAYSIRPSWVRPRFPPSPTHLRPQLASVDADRVVGLVAGLRVGLRGGLHVGADAAVPQQVDRRLEDRLHQLGGGHGRDVVLDPERRADGLVERDRLERAREDAAALGDQVGVVVLPAGPRHLEQPAPLGVRRRGVGGRVEEDVAVVEGRHQSGVLRAQHPVAEHVAGHVADPDRREVLGLAVDAALAEVALHRDPRAAGGDAHGLVVVADRAAARERVAEPEAVVLRHAVGDVGERRGALVGRDHEVGVAAVVAYDAGRRDVLAVDEVVGDVEQAGDERLVAGDPLLQPRIAVARVGEPLAEEPTLGAHRHDHGVLHHLRLDQAEDLGAEVVAAIGPAQAPAGDRAEAQVHALDPRRVDEDLVAGPRPGQVGDRGRLQLERHVGVGPAVLVPLEVVGAQRGLDVREVGPQDPVVVEALHLVERARDLLLDRLDPRGPRLGIGRQPVLAGVESRLEQLDQQPGQLDVVAKRVLHVVQGEG